MTDTDIGASAPAPLTFDYSAYLLREAERNARAAELRPANKATLFDALAAAGIIYVTVVFDGFGDSGQIESVEAREAHGDVALPEGDIELASPNHDGTEVNRHTLPIREAIEQLAYDFLDETHGGWENNEGAFGDFTFDVAARSIRLAYNERYETSELFEREW